MAKNLRKVKGAEFLLRTLGGPQVPVEVITMHTGMFEYNSAGGDTLEIDHVATARLSDGSERVQIYVRPERQT